MLSSSLKLYFFFLALRLTFDPSAAAESGAIASSVGCADCESGWADVLRSSVLLEDDAGSCRGNSGLASVFPDEDLSSWRARDAAIGLG